MFIGSARLERSANSDIHDLFQRVHVSLPLLCLVFSWSCDAAAAAAIAVNIVGRRRSTRAGYEGLDLVPGRDEISTPETQLEVEQMAKPSVDKDEVKRLTSSSFDRFVGLLDAHSTKQVSLALWPD